MKKEKTATKLSLAKETLLQLSGAELINVAGGSWSCDTVCPTVTSYRCGD